MQPDSKESISPQATLICGVGLMDWPLLLNSISSWILMKKIFFFYFAEDAVIASKGWYGKVTDSFSFTKAGAWRFQLATYKRRGAGDHAGTISGIDAGTGDHLQASDPGSASPGSPVRHCAKRRKSKLFSPLRSWTDRMLSTAGLCRIHSIMEYFYQQQAAVWISTLKN